MPATYEKIQSITLDSASGSIGFTSISATYTDLRVVIAGTSSANGVNLLTTFNGDSGSTNYSRTLLKGNGTTATSERLTSFGNFNVLQTGFHTTNMHLFTIDIFSYADSTFKHCLFSASEDNGSTGQLVRASGQWRSTSAISSISFVTNTGTMSIGSTFTLYGILKA